LIRLIFCTLSLWCAACEAVTLTGVTMIVSSRAGVVGDDISSSNGTSVDGRLILFTSRATNLYPGDFNGMSDVFVRDRYTGQIELISRSADGGSANGSSSGESISSNGRYVSFRSAASNLVPFDTNGVGDGFVYDRVLRVMRRVTVKHHGGQLTEGTAGYMSADGSVVAYVTAERGVVPEDQDELSDVFVHDLSNSTVRLASVAHDGGNVEMPCSDVAISRSGRYVAFVSRASNLVPDDDPWFDDVFFRDMETGINTKVSRAWDRGIANEYSLSPAFSESEQFIAFTSFASNIVNGDSNGVNDCFVHEISSGLTILASVNSQGVQGNHYSAYPRLSANGRYVVMHSGASNLVPGDTNSHEDVFIRDLKLGITQMVTATVGEHLANDNSRSSRVSANGEVVVFTSNASNLGHMDNNFETDAFIHDRAAMWNSVESISMLNGAWTNGGLTNFSLRDNNYVKFAASSSGMRGTPIAVEITSALGNAEYRNLVFELEGKSSTGRILAAVQLFNFDSQNYETLSTSLMSLQDRSITIEVYDYPNEYVDESGRVRARLLFEVAWGRVDSYFVLLDQARWIGVPN